MMELKHVMSQAAQDLDDGETRHESREAEAREHEEVQWMKHASRSDSEAQQPDLTSRGGVLGECVNARCPHHRSTTTNTAQPQRVGALLPMPSCLGIGGHPSGSRQGHPRYTGARTTGRPWVAHTNAQRAKCTCHDAYSRQSNTHKYSDKHGSGADDHQLQVTITNRRRRLSRYRRRSSSIRYR